MYRYYVFQFVWIQNINILCSSALPSRTIYSIHIIASATRLSVQAFVLHNHKHTTTPTTRAFTSINRTSEN